MDTQKSQFTTTEIHKNLKVKLAEADKKPSAQSSLRPQKSFLRMKSVKPLTVSVAKNRRPKA